MKPIKTLAPVALAALIAMAFAAAPSAMAEETALCASEAEKCKVIDHVHEASVGKAKLLSTLITVECDVLFLGDAVEVGSPFEVEGSFTYTNCGSCTVEETSESAIVEILKLGHETGDVTYEYSWLVKCSSFIDCEYNGVGLKGTAKGELLSTQKNGEISLKEQTANKVSGFLCPKTAKLDITTTPLSSTYIVEPHEVHAVACLLRALGDFDDNTCESDILDRLRYALFAY